MTFTRNIAPILYKNCVSCHRAGEVAPMQLITYKEVRPWGKAIAQAVLMRKMPPWHADPHYGEFSNDRRLSDADIETIRQWVSEGVPEGDAKDLPSPLHFPEGWRAGKPDLLFPIPSDQHVAASDPDRYLYFKVPTHLDSDVWVQSVEVKPGNRKVVHHAHVYLDSETPSESKPELTEKPKSAVEMGFLIKDRDLQHVNPAMPVIDDGCSDASGGYWPGKVKNENGGMLGSYLPGRDPDVFPLGFARKIPKGATLVFQIHYHPAKDDEMDREFSASARDAS